MPTVTTIGSGGTYSSIQNWINAWTTGGWVGGVLNQALSVSGGPPALNITGIATTATDYITLTTAPGASFRDNANAQTNRLAFSTSTGASVTCTQNYGQLLQILVGYCTVSNLQFLQGSGTPATFLSSNFSTDVGCVWDSIIAEAGGDGNAILTVGRGTVVRNSLLYVKNSSSSGVCLLNRAYDNSLVVANCTFARGSDLTVGGSAIGTLGGVISIINTAVFGFTNFNTATNTPTGSNNATSASSIGFGSSNQTSVAYTTATFAATTNAAHDYRLVSGSALVNNGTTDTTDVPADDDIVGTIRPWGGVWDIGTWELQAGSPPPSSTAQRFPTAPLLGLGIGVKVADVIKRNEVVARRGVLGLPEG